jgi:carbon monoxide dehydrogenase subunit G
MIESTSEETLDHSPDVVFDFIADVENEPVWNPDLVSGRQTSPGPVREGSTRTGEYKHIGRVDTTITTYDRPHRMVFRATGKQADMTLDFRFAPAGSGTRMSVHGTLALRGPLRFAEGALRGVVAQQYAERARAIKRALDARAAGDDGAAQRSTG